MITPRNIYEFAVRLYSEVDAADPDEVLIRTIIGRAYYAVFLALRNLSGIVGQGGRIHGAVREFFQRKGGEGALISLQLDDLRKRRNRADYDDGEDVSIKEAVDALSLCRRIFEAMSRV